jgi:serine/threonine-protein phosphatase 6 regulatory ankyrin repeat subunit B
MVDRILANKYPLHEAVLNSSFTQVVKMLRKNESITEKDRSGRTPLHVAVSCRNPELIKLFLQHGADVISADTLLGLSPVEYAIKMDDWEMLSLLMEKRPGIRKQVLKGTNCNYMESTDYALCAAAQYGHNDLLTYLISEGSSVNVALPGDNGTLLHVAARCQQTETVKLLLQLGASIDCQDESGKTSLRVSVETGIFEVKKCFVEHREVAQSDTELQHVVNPERTIKKRNSLKIPEVVRELLEHGANVNTADNEGETPLHIAGWEGHVEVVQELLEHGANVNTADIYGRTPLHVAVWKGRAEVVRELLEHGANVNNADKDGRTPLHMAGRKRRVEVVRELLEHDANVNTADIDGRTPLHTAGLYGHVEVVRELLEHGADVNTADKDGRTPLHIAGRYGHVKVVRVLLENGADVNTADNDGHTPLYIAGWEGHVEVVRELLKHGANVNTTDKDVVLLCT